MKKKEKTVLCLIFLAAILYSGITYIANGAAILDYYLIDISGRGLSLSFYVLSCLA